MLSHYLIDRSGVNNTQWGLGWWADGGALPHGCLRVSGELTQTWNRIPVTSGQGPELAPSQFPPL